MSKCRLFLNHKIKMEDVSLVFIFQKLKIIFKFYVTVTFKF